MKLRCCFAAIATDRVPNGYKVGWCSKHKRWGVELINGTVMCGFGSIDWAVGGVDKNVEMTEPTRR